MAVKSIQITAALFLSKSISVRVFFVLMVVTLLGMIVISSLWVKMWFEKSKIIDEINYLDSTASEYENSIRINKLIQENEQFIKAANARFAAKQSLADISMLFTKISRRNQLRIDSQAFVDMGDSTDNVGTNYIKLNVVGSYKDLRAMLVQLSDLQLWTEIVDLHIEQYGVRQGIVRAQITVATRTGMQ